jgi:DNA repair photolyase
MPNAAMTYDDVYRHLYHQNTPTEVHYGQSESQIIRPARGFVDGFDLTMQTQVGCPAGCLFCYVPAGRMLTPAAMRGEMGERWGFEVRRKIDAVGQFAAHLKQGELAGKVIYWSGVTDPYAAPAGETRAIWEHLNAAPTHLRPRRVIVQTRFRPDRDALLMHHYERSTLTLDEGPAVVISYSIGTDRDDLIRAWERATPMFEQRMRAIDTLREAGLWVVPTLSPFGLWNNLAGTLRRFQQMNIPYITYLFFKRETHSANTPAPFISFLEQNHPLLLDPHWQQSQRRVLEAVYGEHRALFGKPAFASLAAPHQVDKEYLSVGLLETEHDLA